MTRTMLRAIFITLSDLMSEVQLKSTKLTTNPKGSPIPQNTGDKRTGIKSPKGGDDVLPLHPAGFGDDVAKSLLHKFVPTQCIGTNLLDVM